MEIRSKENETYSLVFAKSFPFCHKILAKLRTKNSLRTTLDQN